MAAFLTLPESLRLMWWMPPAWYRGGMVIPPSLAVPRWLGVFTCRLQQPFLFFAGYIIFRQTIMRTYIQLYIYIFSYMIYIYIRIHKYPEIFVLSGDTVTHRAIRSRVPGSLGQLAGDAPNIGRVRLALDPGWKQLI